jgi:phosphopantothenoylcysteine decarboxylase/phosphopantothenate--cysteine ligase
MGYALAAAAWRRGSRVTLVSGPSDLPDPAGVEVIRVESAREMADAVFRKAPSADILAFSAAVADYRPMSPKDQKVKRSRDGIRIELDLGPTEDIALATREIRKPGAITLGFALETEDLIENARKKLEAKGFDLIAANPAKEEGVGFNADRNRVTVLNARGGVEELPALPKEEVAERLLDRLSPFISDSP